MPSLSLTKYHNLQLSSYSYYLDDKPIYSEHDHVDTIHNIKLIPTFLRVIAQLLALSILFNLLLPLDWAYYDDHSYWLNNHIFYIWATIQIITQFIFISLLMIIFFNVANNSILIIFVISFIFNVIIGGFFFYYILYLEFDISPSNDNFVNTNILFTHCKFFDCNYFTIYYLYSLYIYPLIIPFLCVITSIYSKLFITIWSTNIKRKLTKQAERNNTIDIPLLVRNSTVEPIIQNDDNIDDIMDDKSYFNLYSKWVIAFWTLFSICCMFLYLFFAVSKTYLTENPRRFDYLFWYLSFICFIFKLMLKRIARRIDIIRIISNEYKNAIIKTKISFELFVEFLMSILYWFYFRNQIVVQLSNVLISQYFLTVIFHLLSELRHSTIRFSKLYYTLIPYLGDKYGLRNNWFCSIVFCTVCYKGRSYTSNLYQWQMRQSLDVSIRFCASLITAIISTFDFVAFGRKEFDLTHDEWKTALILSCIAILMDMLYFGKLFMIHLKFGNFFYKRKFNMFKGFLYYVNGINQTLFISCFVAASIWATFLFW